MRVRDLCLFGALLPVLLAGCAGTEPAAAVRTDGVPVLHVQVLRVLPHDRTAFTEGLELAGGLLYEGTGRTGQSRVQVSDPATGAVRQRVDVPGVFGEGITVLPTRIWQLTWQDGVAIERDRASLRELRRVPLTGEGWGLCHRVDGTADGTLVQSDGTDRLTFRDPVTFAPTGELRVRSAGSPVTMINELECTADAIYANVWKTDTILRIDPANGVVTGVADLAGLLPEADRPGTDVLNGIAAVPGTDQFLVTGKLWPRTFQVRFTVTTGPDAAG